MSFVSFCFVLPVLFFFVFMGSGCGSGVKEGKRSPGVGWDGMGVLPRPFEGPFGPGGLGTVIAVPC